MARSRSPTFIDEHLSNSSGSERSNMSWSSESSARSSFGTASDDDPRSLENRRKLLADSRAWFRQGQMFQNNSIAENPTAKKVGKSPRPASVPNPPIASSKHTKKAAGMGKRVASRSPSSRNPSKKVRLLQLSPEPSPPSKSPRQAKTNPVAPPKSPRTSKQVARPKSPRQVTSKQVARTKSPRQVTSKQVARTKSSRQATSKQVARPKSPRQAASKQVARPKSPRQGTPKQVARPKSPRQATSKQVATVKSPRISKQVARPKSPRQSSSKQVAPPKSPRASKQIAPSKSPRASKQIAPPKSQRTSKQVTPLKSPGQAASKQIAPPKSPRASKQIAPPKSQRQPTSKPLFIDDESSSGSETSESSARSSFGTASDNDPRLLENRRKALEDTRARFRQGQMFQNNSVADPRPEAAVPKPPTASSKHSKKATRIQGKVGRRYYKKPGMRALMEIQRFQKSTELLMRKLPFQRLVREITVNVTSGRTDVRWQSSALTALQESCEHHIVSVMEMIMTIAMNANRVTILERDFKALKKLHAPRCGMSSLAF